MRVRAGLCTPGPDSPTRRVCRMPVPTTSDEFVDLIRKSGVVDPGSLENQLAQLRQAGSVPAEPKRLAALLVRDGILTYFQAEQLLAGKWRGFTIGKYQILER